MFDKLKTKFILINMTLLSTVFIGIFSAIFYITSLNMNKQINNDLFLLLGDKFPPPHTLAIIVEINNSNQIINIKKYSQINIDLDKIKNSAYDLLEKYKNNKTISIAKIDNTCYSYLINKSKFGTKIALIDRTNVQTLLTELLKTFILIVFLSLVILFLISIYLTNKSIKPIKEAFEKQKQFITDASHELKTPLTIIKTNTSVLLSNTDDTIKNQLKWINYINSQTDRMSTLINEMLTLSKLDIEENKLPLSVVDVSSIMENILLMFDAIIYENNIELNTNIQKNLFINADKESIKKLFSILIDNAIKYNNENGKINIDLINEKNKVKITIKNTGCGIPKEDLDRIFERFYRVDSSRDRKTGGYGLGLSIANSIVKQHNGKIYAKSIENQETSFIIELPLKKQGS